MRKKAKARAEHGEKEAVASEANTKSNTQEVLDDIFAAGGRCFLTNEQENPGWEASLPAKPSEQRGAGTEALEKCKRAVKSGKYPGMFLDKEGTAQEKIG